MNLNIERLNSSQSNENTALKWITKQYNQMLEAGVHGTLQNITEMKYGGHLGYEMISYDPEGIIIFDNIYLQNEDVILDFGFVDRDDRSYEGELFDKIANTTMFFD